MHLRRSPLALLALMALLLAACTAPATPTGGSAGAPRSGAAARQQPAASPDYFAGKTITLQVNYSAGGPTDVSARMIAQYLGKHVPGNPQIIVENKAGAGGLVGKNYVYNVAKKDGTLIGVFSATFGHQLVSGDGVQYDSSKFNWLAGFAETAVGFVGTGTGVRTGRELATTNAEIISGGLAPDTTKDMSLRTFLNMLGLKYKYVTGYPGSADARLAFQRGEINFYEDSLTSWFGGFVPMMKEGVLTPIGQQGLFRNGQVVRDPRVPDYPTYQEIAVEARGESVKQSVEYRAMTAVVQLGTMLLAVVYPPGVDPSLVEMMRQAVSDTLADPEYRDAFEKQLGFPYELIPGAEAQSLAEKIVKDASEDQEALEYLRRLSREKQG